MLINLFLISECFKVYFGAKSWFLKYKSGHLYGHKMKKVTLDLEENFGTLV
jgi:hypothetical protein